MTKAIDPCLPVRRRKVNKAHTIKAWKKIKAKHKVIPVCRHPGKLEDLLTLPPIDFGQLVTLDDTIPIVTAPLNDVGADVDDGGPGVTTVVTDDTPVTPTYWQEPSYAQTYIGVGSVESPVKAAAVPEPGCYVILALGIAIAWWLRRRSI